MKKTLIALAALGVVGAASAGVTVSGEVSGGISKTGTAAAGIAMHDLDVNFTSTEDLGGGLSLTAVAGFEGSARKGAVTGSKGSLDVSGGFGKISIGTGAGLSNRLSSSVISPRDMSSAMGGTATGVSGLQTAGYTLPAFGPVTVSVGYSKATTVGSNAEATTAIPLEAWSDDSTANVNVAYSDGPITASLNHRKLGARNRYAIGYDAGVAKVDVAFGSDKQTEVLVRVPVGAITVDLHTGSTQVSSAVASGASKATATGLAVVYALSKSTSVNYSTINIKDSAESTNNGNHYRVELSHKF
jgi:hypothetical protein